MQNAITITRPMITVETELVHAARAAAPLAPHDKVIVTFGPGLTHSAGTMRGTIKNSAPRYDGQMVHYVADRYGTTVAYLASQVRRDTAPEGRTNPLARHADRFYGPLTERQD
jgi:hypothetical protein